MKDKFFIDTNVFVYTFSSNDPAKKEESLTIIKGALSNGNGCISYQVVQEFFNVALKKFIVPLSHLDCRKYFNSVLEPICEVYAGPRLFGKALEISERWKLSFYDSLIVAAALFADCEILYSEDLQHNQQIETLKIVDPYR